MVVVVEILRNLKDRARWNGWTKMRPDMNIVVHIPDRGVMGAMIIQHKVRMEVAVKIGYFSPAGCNGDVGIDDVGVESFGRCRRDDTAYKTNCTDDDN